MGKYKKEKSKSLKLASSTAKQVPTDEDRIERLTYAAQAIIVDPEKQLERLRKEQNEFLLIVLSQEKRAEEERERALKQLDIDMQTSLHPDEVARERQKLELLFVDERKRASERIIALTKEHEAKIREAVVQMMDIRNSKKQ
jgi:outer membrane translocation and assembly module TamA